MTKLKKSPLYVYLLILIPVFLLETFLFNINAIRSLNYKPKDITEYFSISQEATYNAASGNYIVEGEEVTLYAEGLDLDVHNLHLDMDFSDGVVFAKTHISDEGNQKSYGLSTQTILGGYPNSKYISFHPYGKVHSIKLVFEVDPGTAFQLHNITCNAKKPFHYRFGRMLTLYSLFAFCVAMRKNSVLHKIMFDEKDKKQIFAGTVITVFALFGTIIVWKSNVDVFNGMNFPEYQQITKALTMGQFYLEEEVDESLLALDNPYDYSAREEAGNVVYPWDTAYYNGKYYCYFGLAPVFLVYLPCYLLTGSMPLNSTVALIFALGMVAGSFYLIRQLMIRYFPRVPFVFWPLLAIVLAFSENFFYLYMRPDFYDVPIITANALSIWGIALWLKGLNTNQGKMKTICYGIGSLSMALVSGARPQMLLLSFLAIPLFWEEVFVNRELFSKKSIVNTVAFCLPYIVVGGFTMFYNFSRFGSVFEFGAKYNLTTNDVTRRGFNLDRLGGGLLSYLVIPPVYLGTFPFVQPAIISSRYMGKMVVEFVMGGILSTNLISWMCLGSFWIKDILKKCKVWGLVLTGIAMTLILGCAEATLGGLIQRYTADISLAILFPSGIVAGIMLQYLYKKNRRCYHLVSSFLVVALIFSLVFDFCMLFVDAGVYNISVAREDLYYAINSYFVL